MRAWVTDCPNFLSQRVIPMKFRYHSAMMGTLGIGCNILKLNEEEIELSKEMIKEYKDIRHIVQEGSFYRLENTSENDYALFQYVKEGEVLLFAFLPQSKLGHSSVKVKLRGLDSSKTYKFHINEEEVKKSGSYLMNQGIDIKLIGDYDSKIIKFVCQ